MKNAKKMGYFSLSCAFDGRDKVKRCVYTKYREAAKRKHKENVICSFFEERKREIRLEKKERKK